MSLRPIAAALAADALCIAAGAAHPLVDYDTNVSEFGWK